MGKGVVSSIVDDELMPYTEDGEPIHMILNPEGMPNRENGGQIYELDITSLSNKVIKVIKQGMELKTFDNTEAYNLIVDYIRHLSNSQAEYIDNIFKSTDEPIDVAYLNDLARGEFVDGIIEEGRIKIRMLPIQESLTIDDLAKLHDDFPFDNEEYLMVPLIDSNGKVRYVRSMRKVTVGYKYTYRMKQYAEEKFSVTSLSSTNLRNKNSRTKASASYRATHASTPIKIGDMEASDLLHTSPEVLIMNLMILSLSPIGRREVSKLLTEDPYDVDITVPMNAKNRSVEEINAYLKAIGLELEFTKERKFVMPMVKEVDKLQQMVLPAYPEMVVEVKDQ